uniref:Uncharacterized protein n=1 Tax=Junco hyemalis TaxID=40217 RepID=A0A8C5NKM3_JUNHY
KQRAKMAGVTWYHSPHHTRSFQLMSAPANQAKTALGPFAKHTHKFKHVPVKDVVIGEALAVEEVAEELPQVRVVRFIIKPQRTAEVEVCRELSWREQRTADDWGLPSNLPAPTMEGLRLLIMHIK